MNSLDTIMRKIIKLKHLYEGARRINSEGEAAQAAIVMQKLLAKYNLTISEIDEQEQKQAVTVTHEHISGCNYNSIGGRWETLLTNVICRWNFCRCYTNGSIKRLVIVGRKENLEMVKWLLDVLRERYVEFSKQEFKIYKQQTKDSICPISKDRFQRNYLIGCVEGLDKKLQEEHDRQEREQTELSQRITALVQVRNIELEAYVDKIFHNVYKYRLHIDRNAAGYNTGYSTGYNTQLQRPIAAGETAVSKQLLLE